MTKSLGITIARWLNVFPSSAAVIGRYIPDNIVEGKLNPDFSKKRIFLEPIRMHIQAPTTTLLVGTIHLLLYMKQTILMATNLCHSSPANISILKNGINFH